MNRNFLTLYNNELSHLREMAGEFAREFPKIAGRLALEENPREACADPFVERLLEGFAFLTARVQLKLEAEFPRFTQSLLESVYPHYLCPTPSMAIVKMEVDPRDPGSVEGFSLARGSSLRSISSGGEVSCEFRTAHPVHLWPLRVTEARYYTRNIVELDLPRTLNGKAAIRIRLRTHAGVKLKTLQLDRLPIYVSGLEEVPAAIMEQIFRRATHLIVKTSKAQGNLCHAFPASQIQRLGLSQAEALLPFAPRGFEGYRLLQEYWTLPQRFLFFELTGLREAIQTCDCEEVDLVIVFSEAEPKLENRVDEKCFELFCTPVVNLFPKRVDPISLLDRFTEAHVVVDRTNPLAYEIYQIQEVIGLGLNADDQQTFHPFYLARDEDLESFAYFSTNRLPRVLSDKEKRRGAVSSYLGSEVFISLVDALSAPYRSNLQELCITALCTNRHLPIQMPTGLEKGDFTLDLFAPVAAVRCLVGPTTPLSAHMGGEVSWRTISHLSLNYLSLVNEDEEIGAAGLRDILKLYCGEQEAAKQKQIQGVRSITSRPVLRRLATPGPITFARGLELTVTLDELAFEGTGIFVLGSVLERFFARYVSINSFTETVIKSQQRGEIIRWTTQPGKRQIL
ncbi:MAG: type VI secretion system baseplate subunit TssF [Chthoniobacter sp.]